MIKNREEAQLQVTTKIVPTVTNAVHVDLLNNDILNSVVFRKDVVASDTGSGQVGLDFSTDDLIVYTLDDTSVLFTINGMENGDLKYLRVIKDAGTLVTFDGTFDFTENITYSKETDTEVFYAIYKKNNISFVKALSNTIVKASAQDFIDEIDYKFVTPKGFNDRFPINLVAQFPALFDAKFPTDFDERFKSSQQVITYEAILTNTLAGSFATLTRTLAGYDGTTPIYAYDLDCYIYRNLSGTSWSATFQDTALLGQTSVMDLYVPVMESQLIFETMGFVITDEGTNGALVFESWSGSAGSICRFKARFYKYELYQ